MDKGNPNSTPDTNLNVDEDFKRKVRALIKSRELFKQENTGLKQKLSKMEEQIKTLQASAQSAAASTSSQDTSEYERKITELTIQNNQLQNELSNMNQTVQSLSRERETLPAQGGTNNNFNTGPSSPFYAPATIGDSEEDMSRKLGKVLLDAQAVAKRITDEATREAEGIKVQMYNTASTIIEDVEGAQKELESIRTYMSGMVSSLNGRLDMINNLFENAKKTFSRS